MDQGQFVISVAGAAQDDIEELEEACRQLRNDLEEIDDIELSEVVGEPAPAGTRSSAFVTLSTALVVVLYGGKLTLMAADDIRRAKVLTAKIAKVFHQWMHRHEGTRAIIKLPNGAEADLTGYAPEDIVSVLEKVADSRAAESRDAE